MKYSGSLLYISIKFISTVFTTHISSSSLEIQNSILYSDVEKTLFLQCITSRLQILREQSFKKEVQHFILLNSKVYKKKTGQ